MLTIKNHVKVSLIGGSGQYPHMVTEGGRTYILDKGAVIALDKNGALDRSFDGDGLAYLTPDGINAYSISVSGNTLTVQGVLADSYPAELHQTITFPLSGRSNASVDTSSVSGLYDQAANELARGADGSLYLGGPNGRSSAVAKQLPTGAVDFGFSQSVTSQLSQLNVYVDELAVDASSRLYVAGSRRIPADYQTNTPEHSVASLFRFLPDGSIDSSFGKQGEVQLGKDTWIPSLAVLPNGDILVGQAGGDAMITKLDTSGARVVGFGVGGSSSLDLNNGRPAEYVFDLVADGTNIFAVVASYPEHKYSLVPVTNKGFFAAGALTLLEKGIGSSAAAQIDPVNKVIKIAISTWESSGIEVLSVDYSDFSVPVIGARTVKGDASDNRITAASDVGQIDGGAGFDEVTFASAYSKQLVQRIGSTLTVVDIENNTATDVMNVERIHFANGTLAFDYEGTAGQAYRLYKAAFDRVPDASGLGFWTRLLDNGTLTLDEVARQFVESAEFRDVYGVNPTHRQIVAKFYENVLDRVGEGPGVDFWVSVLDQNRAPVSNVLKEFSEGPENKTVLIGLAEQGFFLT